MLACLTIALLKNKRHPFHSYIMFEHIDTLGLSADLIMKNTLDYRRRISLILYKPRAVYLGLLHKAGKTCVGFCEIKFKKEQLGYYDGYF